jgi:transcriptional regulator with XRE-family HTH domain
MILSIGAPKAVGPIIFGMTTASARRMRVMRAAMGFGGYRQAAAFAREIGIEPATLHDIESGKTKSISLETAYKLRAKGGNPDYVVKGIKPVLLKFGSDERMREQELLNEFRALSPENQRHSLELLKTIRRSQPDEDNTPKQD